MDQKGNKRTISGIPQNNNGDYRLEREQGDPTPGEMGRRHKKYQRNTLETKSTTLERIYKKGGNCMFKKNKQ